jgi:threonine aldolase
MIDLRSDTVTQPTPAMRQAMAEAAVGDDVLGNDPTVNELEAETARLLGKPAAVYMPSGTMTNEVALRCHTEPGDEVLLHRDSHVFVYEGGGPAALSGVMCRLLEGPGGVFTADEVRRALRPRDVHFAVSRLVCIENTHNRGGGTAWPIDQLADVAEVARTAGLLVHMDGARLWNAAVATGHLEADYAAHCDSVSVCFSKGLGAPVGSALAGSEEFISRARRFRKLFGGGMRQAGIIAAGALYAVRHHRQRLAEDHANARRLADGLAELPGLHLSGEPQTNLVYVRAADGDARRLAGRLRQWDVGVLPVSEDVVRAVTSLAVDRDDIERAIAAFADACTS